MADSGLSPFCCYYCDRKFMSLQDGVKHATDFHENIILKIRSLELHSENGKLGYRTHNFNIIPKDEKAKGHTIIAEHSCTQLSVRLVNRTENVFEQTILSPLSKKMRTHAFDTNVDRDTSFNHDIGQASANVKVCKTGDTDSKSTGEDIESIIAMMPSVISYLKSEGKLEVWKKFHFLLASRKFPLNNIAFLLFLDVVKWFECDNSVTMRYNPAVNKFWRVGYKLFHGKWLRFMGGPKYKGELLKGGISKGLLDPSYSKINFAVPYSKVRDSLEAPLPAVDIKPGILTYLLDKYSEQARNDQTFKLCFDGKKINASTKGDEGDVDLFGFDGPPNIGAKRQRFQDEKQSIQVLDDLFVEQTIKLKSDLKQISDEDQCRTVALLRNLVHILTSRLQALRESKVSREMAIAKFKKMAEPDWRKSNLLHVISGLETALHDINATISNALLVINKLGTAVSCLNNEQFSFTTDRHIMLSNQTNYVHLVGNNNLPENNQLRFIKQRTDTWFKIRKTAVVTGSTLYKAIGLESLKSQLDHFDSIVYQKEREEPSTEVKERMEHGTVNEINAVATIVGKVLPMFYPGHRFVEEGCYEINKNGCKMIISPDGSIRNLVTDTVSLGVEIKCPAPKPSPVFKPNVHYNLPKYYVPQVLSEMVALGTDILLYVCYTEESTTVQEVRFSQSLWDKICTEVYNIYGQETLSRPTKRSPNIVELKAGVDEFVQSNVTLLCEVQSSKGVECHKNITETNAIFCFHNSLDTFEQKTNITTVQTWLHEIRVCLESGYNLTRSRASEFLGFMISDLDRFFKDEELHAVPIAYALKGYSLSTRTLRDMMEFVLLECHRRGLYVPVCSSDGQWHRLAVRDRSDKPLTLLQLQKDVWNGVKKIDKGKLLHEISSLNVVSGVRNITELKKYVEIDVIHNNNNKTIIVGALKQGKTLKVSNNILSLIKKEKKNKGSPKHQNSDESVNTNDKDNMTNDLLSALQHNEKEVTEDVEKQILDVVTSLAHHSRDEIKRDTPDGDILLSSLIDEVCFENMFSENSVSMEDNRPDDLRTEVTAELHFASVIELETSENTNVTRLISSADIENMLSAVKNSKQSKKNWDIDSNSFVAKFQNACTIEKSFTKAELAACIGPVLGKLKSNGIKCSKSRPKHELASLLSECLGDGSKTNKKVKKIQVSTLKTLARKSIQHLSKAILNSVYAEHIFPDKLNEWYYATPFGSTISVNHQGNILHPMWYSMPEFNDAVDHYLFFILDSYHQFCGARRLICQNGIPAAGIRKENIHKIAKESGQNGCKLNVAIAIDLIDKQNVEFAKTTFSEKVVCELRNIGAGKEAEFCQRMHDWYKAEDEPALPVETRCKSRLALRDWLLQDVDFSKFPPYGAYVKDIPIVLFEGLLTNIERKLQLFPFTKSGSYNVRAVGSMDIENFFGTFQDIDPKGAGVLRPSDIPTALSVAVELLDAQMDPERGFHMQTSLAKVYPCNSMSSNNEDHCMDTSESKSIVDLTMICPRDHQFDAPERLRGKQKRKKGDISDLDAPARGIKPVRQHHKRDESKILPHVRRGLQFDVFSNS